MDVFVVGMKVSLVVIRLEIEVADQIPKNFHYEAG